MQSALNRGLSMVWCAFRVGTQGQAFRRAPAFPTSLIIRGVSRNRGGKRRRKCCGHGAMVRMSAVGSRGGAPTSQKRDVGAPGKVMCPMFRLLAERTTMQVLPLRSGGDVGTMVVVALHSKSWNCCGVGSGIGFFFISEPLNRRVHLSAYRFQWPAISTRQSPHQAQDEYHPPYKRQSPNPLYPMG